MERQNERKPYTTALPTLIDDLRRRFLGVNELPNDYNHTIDRTVSLCEYSERHFAE